MSEAKSTTKLRTVTLGGLGRFLDPPSGEADAPTFDADVAEVIISWLESRGLGGHRTPGSP